MTTNELNREIAKASIEFARLNRHHLRNGRYHALSPAKEKRITDLAEHISKLWKTHAALWCQEQSL